jgi:glc operon protein GlcG
MKAQFLLAAVASVLQSSNAQSQVIDKKSLSLDGAKRCIAAAQTYAREHNANGVVAVVDDGGNLIALERLDNTFAAGANISIGKARTAALFKKPTKFFEDVIKNGRTSMVALNDFTPLQGGVPIVVEGQIIGAIGVSGANSAAQDEELAIAGANALSNSSNTNIIPSLPVAFFDAAKVTESFSKGAVLFDGSAGRNYMIHTSRRDKPGLAEVHALDTDLIYVQEGSFTLVTGGTVVDGKSIASDEIRGASIQGGEIRNLTKGDVIIVPRGVPHWFQSVNGPVTYYTIKVR